MERSAYVAAVVTPPSTTMVWPVMNVEASDARYATAPAISSGSPIRRSGEPEVRRAQKHGLCVMSHSGGNSIPGSSPITHDVLQ